MVKNKFVLVGLGPHAKRIYLKYLGKYQCELALIIDLKSKKDDILETLKGKNISCPNFYFIDDENKDKNLSKIDQKNIKELLVSLKITHAIISSEPKAHYTYAMLFLKNNLNILLDKPILVTKDVISSSKATSKMLLQTKTLCDYYYKKYNQLNFSVLCQRRYNPGYIYIKNIISEITNTYNLGINSLYITSCDGMWNMPDEFFYRENHPYKYGYGKIMHSGYHQVDLLLYLLSDLDYNNVTINSATFTPKDFFNYLTNTHYKQLFKHDCHYDDYLKQDVSKFGEIDFHSLIEFKKDDYNQCLVELQLLQSGFSRRAWTYLPKDTYKGNGRIKHEFLNINLGPLMNIKVLAFQAKNNKENNSGFEYGENNNFEIQIYRNSDLIGGQPIEIIHLQDLIKLPEDFVDFNELSKEECFKDFINNKKGKSDLLTHYKTMEMIKKLYDSTHIKGLHETFTNDNKANYLLAIDSEGTLRQNNQIDKHIENSLCQLHSNTFNVALASGRPLHIIKRFFANKDYLNYFILSNGAYIYDNVNHQEISYSPMNQEVLKYLCKYHDEYNFDINVTLKETEFTTSKSFVEDNISLVPFKDIFKKVKEFCQVRIKIRKNTTYEIIDKFKTNLKKNKYLYLCKKDLNKYEKLVKFGCNDELLSYVEYLLLKEFYKKIQVDLKKYITIGNHSSNFEKYGSSEELTWFSINKKGINKGYGLEIVSKHLNIPLVNTIAIGNDYNDISMLNKAFLNISLFENMVSKNKSICVNFKQVPLVLTLLETFIRQNFSLSEYYTYCQTIDLNVPFLGIVSDTDKILNKPKTRYASRGFIKDGSKIGLFYKKGHNEYKLPGGGLAKNETPTQAFEREILEETGCLIKDVKLIGYVEENKIQHNFRQISFIFTCNMLENTGTQHLTPEEEENDSLSYFKEYDEVYKMIENCYDKLTNFTDYDLYSEKFIIKRDLKILDYFKEKLR